MSAGDTKIIVCTCNHTYQDGKYGPHKRVFISDAQGNFRCSVCLKSNVTITKK